MKPPPFDYFAPRSLDEALALLAEHGDEAQPLAGGQSLVPMMALRVARPAVIVDLRHLAELKGISANGTLKLGAMTRQAEIQASDSVRTTLPALADAMALVGHWQTRNRGTVGGSISLGEPAAENPAFALALDADLELRSSAGTRTVAARDFYLGPYMTARRDDELLCSITYRPALGAHIAIEEVAQRRGDFALSGVVAYIEERGGAISAARLAWFGMAAQPVRATAAEAALVGQALADVDLDALADVALTDTDPPTDVHATADYRRAAGRTVLRRAMQRLGAGSDPADKPATMGAAA